MKNILVTGGAGFIGSNFIHYALAQDPDIVIVNYDALTYAANLHNLFELPDGGARHHFEHANICDKDYLALVIDKYHIDTIVHFAAESHVDNSIEAPRVCVDTNVMGTLTLLEAARAHDLRFHQVSTDEVYGSLGPSEAPWTEDSPYRPHSPYSASKAAADHLVRAYGRTYGLQYTITHSTNNYGPRQHREKLIPMTIWNALEGNPIPIYGDGHQIRDWLHVEDHCAAIWKVLQEGEIGESYHVGAGGQPDNLTVVGWICALLAFEYPCNTSYADLMTHVTDRPGHDTRYELDTTKIKGLGWKPEVGLGEGLLQTTRWYLKKWGKV